MDTLPYGFSLFINDYLWIWGGINERACMKMFEIIISLHIMNYYQHHQFLHQKKNFIFFANVAIK
jgi:hypothetical protein